MKTILVDDDPLALKLFEIECGTINGVDIVGFFNLPIKALEYAQANPVEFALLDIDMPEMDGFELAKRLRKIHPGIVIIFISSHSKYAVEAMKMKADLMIFKPYDREDVVDAIERARLLQHRLKKRVYFKTFGRFAMFVDGAPVTFKSAKAKEILALCVYRNGSEISAEEIIDKLWEDYNGIPGDCSVFRTTVKILIDTLKKYNCDDIIKRERGQCYINKELVGSDYYDFLDDDPSAMCEFQGEFMSGYSWGQYAIYELNEKKQLNKPDYMKEIME